MTYSAEVRQAAIEQWRPLDLYVPTWGLFPLHQSQERLRFVRKPNQVGGTTALVAELWWDALRIHPFRPPLPLDDTPLPFLVMLKDLDGGYGSFCDRMWEWGYRDQLHADCRYLPGQGFYVGRRRLLKLKNGQVVEFRSGTQNLQALESITAGAGYIDEPPKERHFDGFLQRLAYSGGPVLMQFTPVNAGDLSWLRLRIEGDPEQGIAPTMEWAQFRPRLTVADCTTIHGDVIRSRENIEQAISEMSPWQIAQRRDGAWEGDTEGRRFAAFDPSHIYDHDDALPAWDGESLAFDYLRIGMDHGEGDGKQCAYVVGVREQEREYTILAEYASVGSATPAEVAIGIREMLGSSGVPLYGISRTFGDINSAGLAAGGGSYNAHIMSAMQDLFGELPDGLFIHAPKKGRGSVETGEAGIHHAMRERRFFIHRSCTRLIKAIQHYTGPKDRDLKDPIDAVRYAIHDLLSRTGLQTDTIRRRM